MGPSTLHVCVTCRGYDPVATPDAPRAGARLLAAIQQRVADGDDLIVAPVECLSNCQRSCSAAVSAPGKWTYVIGDLDPDQHAGDMLDFARLHQAHEQGLPVWRERPVHIRKSTIARVPPMNIQEQQQ